MRALDFPRSGPVLSSSSADRGPVGRRTGSFRVARELDRFRDSTSQSISLSVRPIIPPSPSSFSPSDQRLLLPPARFCVLYCTLCSYPTSPPRTHALYFAAFYFSMSPSSDSFPPSLPLPCPLFFVIHRDSSCVSPRPQIAPSNPLHTCNLYLTPATHPEARPHRRNTPCLIYPSRSSPPPEAPLHLRVLQYNIRSDGMDVPRYDILSPWDDHHFMFTFCTVP